MVLKKQQLIYIVIVLMAAIATVWLSYEFWRLLCQPLAEGGAVDLMYRYEEVTSFVAGIPVYWELSDAVYPPASYLMMWPLIGWLPQGVVRPYWAVTTAACLALLIVEIYQIVRPDRLTHQVFLALLPLCLYATGAAIGNGQIVIHLMPCLLGSLLILQEISFSSKPNRFRNTVVASLLMVLALVKPNVTAPFFWILLFKAPLGAALTAGTYTALTVFSATFQPAFEGPIALFKSWLTMGMAGAYYGSTPYVEYEGGGSITTSVNAHSILGYFNFNGLDFVEFSRWNQLASLIALILLGLWTYRHRASDLWILASVSAIVSKSWTYHGWYDDLILILPMLVLFKIAYGPCTKGEVPVANTLPTRTCARARILFIAMFLVMLAPGGVHLLPQPWNSVYLACQTTTILAVLIFMIFQIRTGLIQPR